MTGTSKHDADLLEQLVRAELPPSSTWTMPPRGYRQSLALCVLDGVARQVVGATADGLVAALRARLGEAAESAPVSALAAALDDSEWLTDVVGEGDATADVRRALADAVDVLTASQVQQPTDLVALLQSEGLEGATGDQWIACEPLTRRMWADTAMLAGYLDPQVDRIISGYVARAIGSDPATTPAERVIAVLTEVAARFDAKILPLEFAMLEFERAK